MLYLVNILGCRRSIPYPSAEVTLGQYLRNVIVPLVECRLNEERRTAYVLVQTYDAAQWVEFNDASCDWKLANAIADESTLFYSCDVVDEAMVAGNMGAEVLAECSICLVKLWKADDFVLLCGHKFHVRCLQRHVYGGHADCPMCRRPMHATENAAMEWTRRMVEKRRI